MSNQFIKNFSKISKKDVDIVGGKGASLGEMLKFKMPIPFGFVITAKTFDYFLEKNDICAFIKAQLKKINYNDPKSIISYSEAIRSIIFQSFISENILDEILKNFRELNSAFVAVRSSATAEDLDDASWAGELETYLNTDKKHLLENVKKCWSSLFTPRAIFYRKEKELSKKKVSVAVVVQEMIESEISGICFTVHPITKDKNQMIIEAGWGLGEAIVSGSITPDSYVVNKINMFISDINISKKDKKMVRCLKRGVKWENVPKEKQEIQVLFGDKIIELAKICIAIEKHYKKPQDIEWAYKKGKFYITQSRPITTL